MDTLLDLAYLAGVLDSDGSIFVTRRMGGQRRVTHSYYLTLSVAQTLPQAVELFAYHFGGRITIIENRKNATFPMRQLLYRWTAYTRQAAKCIEALSPYIRIKREQVVIAERFRKTFGDGTLTPATRGRKVRPEIARERAVLWEQMRQLNVQNGKGHPRPQVLRLMR